MAIYRGATKVAGIGKGFSPENVGNTGDKLEKTNTGYQWVDGNLVEITEGGDDYSAMRGPCAEGFHIPSETELGGLVSLVSDLGLSANDYAIKLHIPFAGFLSDAGTKLLLSDMISLWTCTKSTTDYAGVAYRNYNGSVSKYINGPTTYGMSIRPFKDLFIEPTASWTVIQGTLGSAGIFRDTVNGLISITGDGTTGYTISDKNLGATTVYSDGDTLSEANCGKYYQWGNNYGFLFTGPTTTSTTAIDASSYGPGNYYNSSTFIKINGTWDSSHNANLRGGVIGVTIKGSEVTAGNILVYKTIQVKLFSYGWSSNEQTVRANGVTTTNTVIVSPDTSSFDDYTGATIYCSAQSTDSLTFTCDTEPSNDITVNVMIFS